ncbi:MAG: hypothetical protein AAFN77_10790 [Planctomycetota bacterium]
MMNYKRQSWATLLIPIFVGILASAASGQIEKVIVENEDDVPMGVAYKTVMMENGKTGYQYPKGAQSAVVYSNPWNEGEGAIRLVRLC